MNKWDFHKFFDSVYNVLLDQKYLHGVDCQNINEDPEVDLEDLSEEEPSAVSVRYTIR